MAQRILTLILLLCSTSTFAGLFDAPGRSDFVPADQAFVFDFQQHQHDLTLNWQVKKGYYLYRQQIRVTPAQASIGPLSLPEGERHEDEFYGKTDIYRQQLSVPLKVTQAAKGATLTVTYQGCADAGFCYPPETKIVPLMDVVATTRDTSTSVPPATSGTVVPPDASGVSVPPDASGVSVPPDASGASVPPAVSGASVPPLPSGERAGVRGNTLPFSALWALLIGIGIAFTPCVLPMYPLISGIVLGGKQRLATPRALLLAFIYVQGMALTYTALGLVVAAAGLSFQAALQHPYVLIGLSVLFSLLALSMFGLFTLQLPASLQTRLALWSNHQKGGSMGGVFVMGAIAGLICSPCTTAPLSAILLYIAQSGNLWLGGGTLYLYALGMGLPLILVTVFGNRLLPKSGPWMEQVKIAFGFVILALPVFLLERVFGEIWGLRLWALLGIAFFTWAFITSLSATRSIVRVLQIALLGAALVCARPLQDWVFGVPAAQAHAALAFKTVKTVDELNQALAQANGRPVMLDLYAEWCVACKEFEKYTFSDPQVQAALKNTLLLQADVTANNAQDTALLRHLNVLGLPTILFFDTQGQEQPAARVTGFMDAAAFTSHLRNQAP
ncbi:thiol:disulfide interchange protein DsbD [Enterobacter sp. AG5470]|nr:thiol:disulfide interchange protein DsbD [Enterobacter sp. AG5470]